MRKLPVGHYADLRTGQVFRANPVPYCSHCHGPDIVRQERALALTPAQALVRRLALLAPHNEHVALTGERAYPTRASGRRVA